MKKKFDPRNLIRRLALRGKPQVRLSIRAKMVLYMTAIFFVMLMVTNLFIARIVSQGNEDYINDDLVVMKNNGLIYARQLLVMGGHNNDEQGFAAIAQQLVEELA